MTETRPGDKGVGVLWRAGAALCVDKPPGVPTTGRTLRDPDCLQHQVAEAVGREVWAVHQLDKETSGVVVFVTKKSAVASWQRRLRAPSTKKDYLAVVHGLPAWDKRELNASLAWDARAGRQREDAGGKRCRTLVRVAARGDAFARVEARLLTGRTHQIRAHLAGAGHPLAGEGRYREPPSDAHDRVALHARALRFFDDDGAEVQIKAPVPSDLVALCARLELALPVGSSAS